MAALKRKLVWSADAEADLLSVWNYGAREWSPVVADKHEQILWRLCVRLLENPYLGIERKELIAGLRSVAVDPHVVFYRISARAVEIVRIVHHSEDIETIFD